MLSLICKSALLLLASSATFACTDNYDDAQLKAPPPVVAMPGKKPSGGAGSGTPAGMITSATTATTPALPTGPMMMVAAANDADGGGPVLPDAGADADDAGVKPDAGSGGGAAGRPAAGSGGAGGRGGAGGSGGAAAPTSCQNQFCFSIVDCWVLSGPDCNYTDCTNFTCQ